MLVEALLYPLAGILMPQTAMAKKKLVPKRQNTKKKKQAARVAVLRAGRKETIPPAATEGDEPVETEDGGEFPIVGLRASAGGLETFSEMLRNLPESTGMGYV